MYLAVNGNLMRGFELNKNLTAAGGQFLKETTTGPCYRLWSISDRYPAMQRDPDNGSAIALEIWEIDPAGLVDILVNEPSGLTIGRIELADGSSVLGVLGEAYLAAGQIEITAYGGWRMYRMSSQAT